MKSRFMLIIQIHIDTSNIKKFTVLMSHGVAAGSIGLEGDGPTTLRLQTNKSLEYVKINIKKELSCIVICIELVFRK